MVEVETTTIGGKRALRGSLGGHRVLLLPAGMGKTNAAQGLTALLEGARVSGVIGFGVGGAYPGSGLETGDLAVATREVYGDEGVAAPEGWLSTREIGIPLAALGGEPLFNEFELDPERVAAAVRALGPGAVAGPFVTVSTCSGTLARGAELAGRYGAICESMEGAAYAHVCALYATPFLEVRGISNLVEDRDMSRWRLRPAASAAARAVEVLVASWSRNSKFKIQNSQLP
jgi:futalosine hydrolase